MQRFSGAAVGLIVSAMLVAPSPLFARQHSKRHSAPAKETAANPKQERQYVTVEEFVKARLSAHTAASVEGYALLGYRAPDGSLHLTAVDSVDHVLNVKDADGLARSGAVGVIPGASVAHHPAWGWTAKGVQRFAMYTGAGHAQKSLHDSVTKIRLTGFATGKTLSPVTRLEYQDENGDWKAL